MRSGGGGIPADAFLRLAHARELPWLGDLGLRLAGTFTVANLLPGQWHPCDFLLREAGVRPPVTEGVTRAWLSHRLQAVDPFLDDLLPAVFRFDGAGAVLNEIGRAEPSFPDAVTALVASGRLDRPTYLALTLDRLVRGGGRAAPPAAGAPTRPFRPAGAGHAGRARVRRLRRRDLGRPAD